MVYWVYILQCKDGSLYTGITSDIKKRMLVHNTGKGAKYTRGRLPVTLLYKEKHPNKSQALKREAEIKKMSRKKKLEIINVGNS